MAEAVEKKDDTPAVEPEAVAPETKPAEATPAEPDSSGVSEDLAAEINAGVDDTITEIEKEREASKELDEEGKPKPKPKKDVPAEEEPPVEEEEEEEEKESGAPKKDGDDDPDPITDELLERAVMAGLKIADAKKCPSASMLADMCTQLETAKKPDGKEADGDEDNADEDPLAGFPELDPDVYDEKVVAGFNAFKEVARKLFDENKELKAAGQSNDTKSFFDSQVSGLDDKVTKALKETPEKLTELQEQFNVLEAGYKATEKTVTREDVFSQAAATVLGDVIAKAATDDKANKLRDREGKFISRPSAANPKPKTDAFEDAANAIDKKFGKT